MARLEGLPEHSAAGVFVLANRTMIEAFVARTARRGPAHRAASLQAFHLSMYVREAGHLDEALAFMQEAMSAARSRSLPLLTFLNGRAHLHRLRGEFAEAERDEATLEELGRERDDVRNNPYQLLGRAWAQWLDDRSVALSGLVSAWSGTGLHDPGNWMATWVARMSLRLGDQSVLAEAVSRHRRQRRPGATALEAHDRVIDGLIAKDGGRTTEKAAEVVEQCGDVQRGLEAWADAALLAARAGRSSMAHDRAVDTARVSGGSERVCGTHRAVTGQSRR